MRQLFATFGVPHELSSDGGPEFKSDMTARFLKDWDVSHRVSSAYYARSNGRAEVSVKAAKRLLRANITPSGSLDNDKFLRAMLQLRNTPDADCCLSPAQIIFGRPLRDSFSFVNRLEKFSNKAVRKTWREAWQAKEDALRVRFAKNSERLNEHTRELPPLKVGDRCLIQNQAGNQPKRWDRSGVVTEVLPFDSYTVKIDGSWRVTRRNRRFLKAYTPIDTNIAFSYPASGPATGKSYSTQNSRPDNIVYDIETPQLSESIPSPVKDVTQSACPPDSGDKGLLRVPKKLPLAVRRLDDFNSPGLKETTVPANRGRRAKM